MKWAVMMAIKPASEVPAAPCALDFLGEAYRQAAFIDASPENLDKGIEQIESAAGFFVRCVTDQELREWASGNQKEKVMTRPERKRMEIEAKLAAERVELAKLDADIAQIEAKKSFARLRVARLEQERIDTFLAEDVED